jgi:vacuolar-type H+-ATPase subunit I/STV1
LRKFFDWYCRQSPWYQASLYSLAFGIILVATPLVLFGKLIPGGALVGMIVGLAIYYRHYRERKDEGRAHKIIDGYPEELENVERRYLKQWLILAPAFLLVGIALSWIIFGIGWYGALAALVALVVATWGLGRFGGPSDPRWKRVRDDWTRRHREARPGSG